MCLVNFKYIFSLDNSLFEDAKVELIKNKQRKRFREKKKIFIVCFIVFGKSVDFWPILFF